MYRRGGERLHRGAPRQRHHHRHGEHQLEDPNVIQIIKGKFNEIFYLQSFSLMEPIWATNHYFKIFLILVKNSGVIQF